MLLPRRFSFVAMMSVLVLASACVKTFQECTSDEACDGGAICRFNAESGVGVCVAPSDGGIDPDDDAGAPRDAGEGEGEGEDAGTDAGVDVPDCGADVFCADAGCVQAATLDGGTVPSTAAHCGACFVPSPSGLCIGGVPSACGVALECPAVDAGDNVCLLDAGVCDLRCDPGFAQCEEGACLSTQVVERCGGCGAQFDLTGRASACVGDAGVCGGSAACVVDGGASFCVQNEVAASEFACVACRTDEDCGGGVCCGGTCLSGAQVDQNCGCAPGLGTDAGADCTDQPQNHVCVEADAARRCGCTADGDAQCGTQGALQGLCNEAALACVAQDAFNCGEVGGVRPASTSSLADAGVVGGRSCEPFLGGPLCLPAAAPALGRCGCNPNGANSCTLPTTVGGVPRRVADVCSPVDSACVCFVEGVACSTATPDCAGSVGCVDLQSDEANCGVSGRSCTVFNGAFHAVPTCVAGGCTCQQNTDCRATGLNTDFCSDGACVCIDFEVGGAAVPCPLGLACVSGGCEVPDAGTFATMPSLLRALGLADGGS